MFQQKFYLISLSTSRYQWHFASIALIDGYLAVVPFSHSHIVPIILFNSHKRILLMKDPVLVDITES